MNNSFAQVAAPGAVALVAGRYELDGLIGHGATAGVYRARHIGTGRAVAVKLLDEALSRDAVAVARFLREARAAVDASHDNVVEVLDVGTDEGRYFMVTELLRGETLEAHLERHGGPLPMDEVAQIVLPLLDALSLAHARGIVHRDLKPANVFLHRASGGRATPKLLDFGICKDLRPTRVAGRALTTPGVLMGTPHYLAPEQAVGGAVDARADVWSAGVLLYRLLVGRVPFDARSLPELLGRAINTSPATPASVGAPQGVSDVVMRCLQKAPELRFADGRALYVALCGALGAEPSPLRASLRPSMSLRPIAQVVSAATVRPPALGKRPEAAVTAEEALPSGVQRVRRIPSLAVLDRSEATAASTADTTASLRVPKVTASVPARTSARGRAVGRGWHVALFLAACAGLGAGAALATHASSSATASVVGR